MCTRTQDRQGTRCSHWVHSRCSGLRNAEVYRKEWLDLYRLYDATTATRTFTTGLVTPTMSDKSFNILQWNANGIGNKQTELSIFLEVHNVKLAAIKDSKLTAKSSCCNGRYSPPIDHLLTGTDSLILGDFKAHHSLWHSRTTDSRADQLADSVSISSFAVLNTDSPTRLPGNADPSYPDVSLASPRQNGKHTRP